MVVWCHTFLLIPLFIGISALPSPGPVVKTKVGLIQGLKGANHTKFLGIPYARVNASNPFGPSIPNPRFDGIFEAYNDSNACPQRNESKTMGTLDCLHLSIYAPKTANPKRLIPVLVYINGEDFETGLPGASIGPKHLVKNNVIIVLVNYRVGPYGFFCLDTPEVPGNQGLKDQSNALRWIKDNIEVFGGDANKVTLMGHGAGSVSANLHLMSPQEKLFDKVILQSGSAYQPGLVGESNSTIPLKVAYRLGFKEKSLKDALKFLIKQDPLTVVKVASDLKLKFRPCVEKKFNKIENFVTDYPANLKIPKNKNISVLIGQTNHELLKTYYTYDGLNIFRDSLKKTFNFKSSYLKEMEEIIRQFYIGEENITDLERWKIVNFNSDFGYYYPIQRNLEAFKGNGVGPVFFYMFSYVGNGNLKEVKLNTTIGGAAHGDELGYIFDLKSFKSQMTSQDKIMIDRMTTMWTNFAKYGDPTPKTSKLLPIKWKAITKESMNYLNIDTELRPSKTPFHDRMAFWKLFYMLNEKLEKGFLEKK